MPPALPFFLKIVLAIWSLLWFTVYSIAKESVFDMFLKKF